jgi:hypothetical protein
LPLHRRPRPRDGLLEFLPRTSLGLRQRLLPLLLLTGFDFLSGGGHLLRLGLSDGGVLQHDMYFAQVKKPSESTKPWDYYKILGTIPGDQAFRSLADSGCPLVAR